MRVFPYITLGKILEELAEEGLPLNRATFYRVEKRLGLPSGRRTSGLIKWRVYTPQEKEQIKELIKKEYNLVSDVPAMG